MGVFPAPDATIQPAAPAIIPGLRVLAIADAMTAEGLACVSEAGTDQEGGGGFTLGCEGQDDIEHARFYLTVTYWTLDAISEIYLSALWNGSGRVVNPAGPKRILSAMSAVASGELATAWIVDHIDDPACNPGCRRTYGSVQLELQVGVNGARALYVLANSG